jgi:hypothetical protein
VQRVESNKSFIHEYKVDFNSFNCTITLNRWIKSGDEFCRKNSVMRWKVCPLPLFVLSNPHSGATLLNKEASNNRELITWSFARWHLDERFMPVTHQPAIDSQPPLRHAVLCL